MMKTIRPLFLLGIITIPLMIKDKTPKKILAEEATLVTTFNSDSLVTSSTYQKYENNEWLLSIGGNNNGIGASSLHASKLTLGPYDYLMDFEPSFTSSTKYVSSLIAKEKMTNVHRISISRGTSNYNYSGVKAYLVRSTSLTANYELVTIIDEITTNSVEYIFDANDEGCYYAVVFYNPVGVFLLGNVVIEFYCQSLATTFSKVRSNSQLYFGATYALACESSNIALSYDINNIAFIGTPISVNNNKIEDNENVLKMKLMVGELIDTFSLLLIRDTNEDEYLSNGIDNQITTSNELTSSESFLITFVDGLLVLSNISRQNLVFDNSISHFIFKSSMSNLSLYLIDTPISHEEEVKVFVDMVLTRGENASGNCNEVYSYLDNVYSRLSNNAKNHIINSSDDIVLEAKERFIYLSNMYRDVISREMNKEKQNDNSTLLVLIITGFMISITYYFLQPRLDYEINF